jgi:hypothetical protein
MYRQLYLEIPSRNRDRLTLRGAFYLTNLFESSFLIRFVLVLYAISFTNKLKGKIKLAPQPMKKEDYALV